VTEQSILIRDALLVPGGSSAFWGWLLVRGNRIAALGPGDPPAEAGRTAGLEVVDGRDRALIPGLANIHAHSHSSLTRGSAEGLPLNEWLRAIEAEQARLTEEQAYYAALGTYCEALLSGTTLIMDMCLFPEAALAAAREVGIRAVIAPYVADTKSFTPTLERTERLLALGPQAGGRLRVWVGLHDLESCSDERIREGAALATRYGAGLHLHCAETRALVEKTLDRTGERPVTHLQHLAALGPRTLLAHGVWLDGAEQALMAQSGSHLAHCPHANLKLGSGFAPVPELLAAGANVGLATDGAKANNRLDMFDVMKFASLIHKGTHLDPALLPAAEVLDMATRRGATALAAAAGVLAPGSLADLCLVRLDRFHMQPARPETIVTNLVHAARGSDVDWVMVDGRVVVAGSRLQKVDESWVRGRLAEAVQALEESG
jgi:5-methylthioadenosine/S-adenosylhomocysteine deaminase